MLLKKSFGDGRIGSFSNPRDGLLISHLMYADDLVIFANGCKKYLKGFMEVLAVYEDWFGELINKDKLAKKNSLEPALWCKRVIFHL